MDFVGKKRPPPPYKYGPLPYHPFPFALLANVWLCANYFENVCARLCWCFSWSMFGQCVGKLAFLTNRSRIVCVKARWTAKITKYAGRVFVYVQFAVCAVTFTLHSSPANKILFCLTFVFVGFVLPAQCWAHANYRYKSKLVISRHRNCLAMVTHIT